ncbi:hypothetical protein [Actinoplanes sp. DH11]|uniref:hypothetical protein n=1 Tax=Actinoplanes sp. DH11 TaxID=2857011 RepID=UPI001E64D499|nr:hypothetical protein [Actinoplanes sp. DH11]
MVDKNIEPVAVDVDNLALEPLGWTAHDIRARLVTEQLSAGLVGQRVAVSGTAQFTESAWADRFSGDSAAPQVLLTLNRRGSGLLPSYAKVIAEGATAAARRPIRFTETSETWTGSQPLTADDLEVRVTGYDFDSVPLSFKLPSGAAANLPVTVVDESTWPSLQVKAMAVAEVGQDQFGTELRVDIEGIIELGTVQELLADHAAHPRTPYDRLRDVPRLSVPGLVIEVTDDTDFLLAKRAIRLFGAVTADETTAAPQRAPRFVAGLRVGSAGLAGEPAQVVVRVLDAADLKSI